MTNEMKKLFMNNLVNEFKAFVLETIDEGMAEEMDHLELLEACMMTFIEIKSEEFKGE
jgi:hypothetical protein